MKKIFSLTFLLLFTLAFFSCTNEKEINVNYMASEGGYIKGQIEQKIITADEQVELLPVTAVANDGYKFVSWSDGNTDATRQDIVSKSIIFTANFQKINTVTVEYRANVGGTIFGTAIQTGENKLNTTQVKAIANDGYRFKGWDDGLKTNVRNDEATEDKVFVALFQKVISVSFSCNPNEGELVGRLNQVLFEGMTTTQVSAIPKIGYSFVGWSTGETSQTIKLTPSDNMEIYAIFERKIEGFPVIAINTENSEPITSKESYLDCSISINNTAYEYEMNEEIAKIRGRGNTSWDSPKKPYKIKFDKAINLFGNGSAKEWTLIANHTDLSLIRNYLAYSVASVFDSQKYTSKTQFVNLYLNGDYVGVYLLCEQIEVHPNRVNITESNDVDTGYLIELDGREDGDGFYVNDEFYAIKSPDTDDSLFTEEHTDFIKIYLENCLNAVSGDDYAEIEALIDTKSFAQAYLVYELFNHVDVGYASFFMYKDAGGKLQCGPVWDFDRSLGITGHSREAEPYNVLWAKQENTWFNRLLNHSEFVSLVSSELENNMQAINDTLDACYEYVYSYEDSFLKNFERWKLLGTYVWPNSGETGNLKTWQQQVAYTKEYLNNSLNYLVTIYLGI